MEISIPIATSSSFELTAIFDVNLQVSDQRFAVRVIVARQKFEDSIINSDITGEIGLSHIKQNHKALKIDEIVIHYLSILCFSPGFVFFLVKIFP